MPIERVYRVMLSWAMRHRWVVVLARFVALLCIVSLGKRLPKSFMADDDQAAFQVNVPAPEGTSLQSTALIAERISRQIREQIPGVMLTTMTIGDTQQHTPNKASMYVRLIDPSGDHLCQVRWNGGVVRPSE